MNLQPDILPQYRQVREMINLSLYDGVISLLLGSSKHPSTYSTALLCLQGYLGLDHSLPHLLYCNYGETYYYYNIHRPT